MAADSSGLNRRAWLSCVMPLIGGALCTLPACGESSRPRCAHCGMFVDTAPEWAVRSQSAQYDAPKCALRAEGTSDALRFRAYYSGEELPGAELVFVVGADVRSPMGDDLVPVKREQSMHFIEDHGGRVVEFDGIEEALLRSLD